MNTLLSYLNYRKCSHLEQYAAIAADHSVSGFRVYQLAHGRKSRSQVDSNIKDDLRLMGIIS